MNLLDKLNQSSDASAKGAASAEPSNQQSPASTAQGDDMLKQVGTQAPDSGNVAATPDQLSADDSLGNSPSSKDNSSGSKTVNDPDSWTKESALQEMKKLREENKASRLKYMKQLEQITAEQDSREAARKAELEEAKKAKLELERLKAEQEDKKKNTEEKLIDREEKLIKLQSIKEQTEAEYQKRIADMEAKLSEYDAKAAAEMEVHKTRLKTELDKIPESFREHAELLTKGAGDPRDALIALNEAKLKGMFEDKTTVVNHSVPGASNGARATKERLESAQQEQRKSMSSQAKIKAGLDAIKSGQPNSAFRQK